MSRAWKALLVIGGILLVIGAGVFYSSFATRTTETHSIPAGDRWYVYFEFNVMTGGSLFVDYASTGSGVIDVFLFTAAQYATYSDQGVSSALHSVVGASEGDFEISLPGSGRYFLAIDHGSGFENVEQSFRATIRLLGIDPAWFYGGIALLALGAVLVVVGLMRKRKAVRTAQTMPPRTDVTFYPEQRPPEPPPPPPPGM